MPSAARPARAQAPSTWEVVGPSLRESVGEGGLTRLAFGGLSCSGASALAFLLARNIFLPSLRSSRAERGFLNFDLNSCTRGVTRITAPANSTCSAVWISFCLAKNPSRSANRYSYRTRAGRSYDTNTGLPSVQDFISTK